MSGDAPDEFVLVVPGKPVPWSKGAPPGKGPQVPDRQAHHAGLIRQCWREQHGDKELWLEPGRAIQVVGEFYLTRPQGQYGSGDNAKKPKSNDYAQPARAFPTGKPDLSNLLKMVEDALTHVVWADDDQVCNISGTKRLIHYWEAPRSIIRITPLPWVTLEEVQRYERERRRRDEASRA